MLRDCSGPVRTAVVAVIVALLVLLGPLLPGPQSQAVENGKQAPDFQLADLAGTIQRLSDYQGKVVVLNFWATWCPECIIEIPSLNAFSERYRDKGVAVLSVSLDKSEQSLRDFLESRPVKFPVMLDRDGDVFVKKYAIRGLPATLIIDRQGAIAAKMLGGQEFLSPDFTGKIAGLLGK